MKTEPAVIGAAAAAILNVVVLLVLKRELSLEEQAAIVTLVTVLAGFFVRSQVSPTRVP